jgi:small subunit ribosomal protein S9
LATTHYYGTGKRKMSVARVFLRPGKGQIQVNGRAVEDYFHNDTLKMLIKQPLQLTETSDRFDVQASIRGGGPSGQAGAMRLGISRALCDFNLELRGKLKKAGFLTRDSRIKERKKYGQPGARKRFQFSKR